MSQALLVMVGGALGSVSRWGLTLLIPAPWGVWLVNLIGCALLSFLLHPSAPLSSDTRLLLGTGVMGGFTTYSTFNHHVLTLLLAGQPGRAAWLAAATFGACLAGGAAGWLLADRVFGAA